MSFLESFRYCLSLMLAKAILKLMKSANLGATAAPGLFAQKIDHRILNKLTEQLDYSLIISGTNGKTTTTRILASILRSAHIPYIHNRTGSNLERGIISELIKHHSFKTNRSNRIGLWEVDEAIFPEIVLKLKPKIIVLTNLFRDQLDRYGEIDTLAYKWQTILERLDKRTIVIINADDPLLACLGKAIKNQAIFFGIRDLSAGNQTLSHASDTIFCPSCFHKLNYKLCFFSHLGLYNCPSCGQIQPQTNVSAIEIKTNNDSGLSIKVKIDDNSQVFAVKLTGAYNVYNLLAAIAVAWTLKIPRQIIIQGLKLFKPAFGRLETIKLNRRKLTMVLVKNPTGFNQVLSTLTLINKDHSCSCLLILNDNIADGRDISWIWDVDFEQLKQLTRINNIIVSGTRAYDLALRLKYADVGNFEIKPNLNKAVSKLLTSKDDNLFIMPTYTALLAVRQWLVRKKLIHSTWKD